MVVEVKRAAWKNRRVTECQAGRKGVPGRCKGQEGSSEFPVPARVGLSCSRVDSAEGANAGE